MLRICRHSVVCEECLHMRRLLYLLPVAAMKPAQSVVCATRSYVVGLMRWSTSAWLSWPQPVLP